MNKEERRVAVIKDEFRGSVRRLKTKEQCKRIKS
jgi:hypothetical protein